jgi:rSAM/selenodomain-associated transferase 1
LASRPALIVFAKWPQAGQVKTRLCPPLDPAEASELYRAFLLDLVPRVAGSWEVTLACHPPEAVASFQALFQNAVPIVPQIGRSLGERMAGAFASTLDRAPAAVLIGSDVPHLPRATLARAFEVLARGECDVTFAGDDGGGYWLVGQGPPARAGIFLDLPMSVPDNFALTLARCAELGLRVCSLEACFDIDTPADLERLAQLLRADDGALGSELPHTASWLRGHGWL